MKEFKIEGSELQFKHKKVSPLDILSMRTMMDFNNPSKLKMVFAFALENTEVNIAGGWMPVKEADKEIYWPKTMEEDVATLNTLIMKFITEVLTPAFPKSEESK